MRTLQVSFREIARIFAVFGVFDLGWYWLTIGKHYTLTGSGAFLHFEASEAQHIGTAYTEMHHEREKALANQGLSVNF